VAIVCAVVVGVVFLVAGVAKLAGHDRWRADAAAMRVPSWLVVPLPFVEVALGALLVAQLWRPVVAAVAALVLLVFTMALIARIAAGDPPSCACFGGWSRRPIGSVDVVRNVTLIVIAMTAALL
jgi:uncharacterized membrane protein YphA (DoxX/SURF4 family)